MSILSKIFVLVKSSFGAVAGFTLCTVCLCWVYGCESKVCSLKQPHLLVNRSELELEVSSILSEIDLKILDLDKQDAFRAAIFNFSVRLAEGQPVDPIALALVLGNILGIGVAADNLRVRSQIKKLNSVNNSKSGPSSPG